MAISEEEAKWRAQFEADGERVAQDTIYRVSLAFTRISSAAVNCRKRVGSFRHHDEGRKKARYLLRSAMAPSATPAMLAEAATYARSTRRNQYSVPRRYGHTTQHCISH